MSFFDKARAGYDNLAGRADHAFDSATASRELGDIDQHFRDLGMIAYLAATGRQVDPATHQRLVEVLGAMEGRGAIRDFVLQTTGQPPTGAPQPPERNGGSDGVPQPPPERAGRHGDFLSQPRASAPPTAAPAVTPPDHTWAAPERADPRESAWASSDPDETTGPRPVETPDPRPTPPPPSIGGTWGPPPQDQSGPTRWRPAGTAGE